MQASSVLFTTPHFHITLLKTILILKKPPLLYSRYIPNLVKAGPVVLERKMLRHDARRTTHDDGRQPIAIGHPSKSDDLKSTYIQPTYNLHLSWTEDDNSKMEGAVQLLQWLCSVLPSRLKAPKYFEFIYKSSSG